MTAIRWLAWRISAAGVRWASPACREWAEASEREMEFVEVDLAALRWAIGSLRLVLDRRVSRLATRRDGPKRFPRWWIRASSYRRSNLFFCQSNPGQCCR
jgi:hypothetical protein